MHKMMDLAQKERVIADLFPGFLVTDWMFNIPSGYEDPETGEWMPGGEPMYYIRVMKPDAFPDAPDGKTGVADKICIRLSDLEANKDSDEAIAALIEGQIDICRASLMDHFAQRGVPYPS